MKCKECGEKGHMRKDCEAVLCYFCGEAGHQKVACPLVKRKKVQLSAGASSISDSCSCTTASDKVSATSTK